MKDQNVCKFSKNTVFRKKLNYRWQWSSINETKKTKTIVVTIKSRTCWLALAALTTQCESGPPFFFLSSFLAMLTFQPSASPRDPVWSSRILSQCRSVPLSDDHSRTSFSTPADGTEEKEKLTCTVSVVQSHTHSDTHTHTHTVCHPHFCHRSTHIFWVRHQYSCTVAGTHRTHVSDVACMSAWHVNCA